MNMDMDMDMDSDMDLDSEKNTHMGKDTHNTVQKWFSTNFPFHRKQM